MANEDAIILRRAVTSPKLLKFRKCMKERMQGESFETKKERERHFCVSAKICSGKELEDAEQECQKEK